MPTPMKNNHGIALGIDVGSTTVKLVVVDRERNEIVWKRYQRHETRQAETLLELLLAVYADLPELSKYNPHAYITGSGAGPLSQSLGARFVQEVNAVTLAVEQLHPEVNSVIELGGQDAKIILFKPGAQPGERRVITSMNDKCASGTGATLDKCIAKLNMSSAQLAALQFDGQKLHHVAAKCGVFAETDIVNLIKAGVPADEVMNSLADAIVMQNLTVLTRGNTLLDKVLLLGGPNTYLPFLQTCWRERIHQLWCERNHPAQSLAPEEAVILPDNAQYFAAFGAVIFGQQQAREVVSFRGVDGLRDYIEAGRTRRLSLVAGSALVESEQQLTTFDQRYRGRPFQPKRFTPASRVQGYIGVDGGSTSSKAVLLSEEGEVLFKAYQISRGNPIEDCKQLLRSIVDYVAGQGCELQVQGFGVTGYAAEVLERSIGCDANVVETIAHMLSAQHYYGDDIDVICDIGGQDIKVLFLENGVIKNFKLSNQCSAGNGMLLQSMAEQFGVAMGDYAEVAFSARLSPKYSYGCAVFLDSDRVNFQREGYNKAELFAGLAQVLPKNVWQYVVQVPRLAELGRRYVLQGGTQYNLAAVKAQVDYIETRVPGAEVMVHPHCGEAGAIGAALEARRVRASGASASSFVGLEQALDLQYTTRTDEETRCRFCENLCSRTFIDTQTPDGRTARYIAGFSCEKGMVESQQAVVALHKERKHLQSLYPNLIEKELRHLFNGRRIAEQIRASEPVTDRQPGLWQRWWRNKSSATRLQPAQVRIGIPRCLNTYSIAPFLQAYLFALGVPERHVLFSDTSSEELWQKGGKFGAIDPCYPAKVSLAHVYQLLSEKQRRHPLDFVWFPSLITLPNFLHHTMADTTCPVVAGTPGVARAAFTKEEDHFARHGVDYVDEALAFDQEAILAEQLYQTWGQRLAISRRQSDHACTAGWRALQQIDDTMQQEGRALLDWAEQQQRIVLLLLARPYHNDPGLNHEIIEEFQSLGYPCLTLRSIPRDEHYLQRYFQHDLASGRIESVFDIRDVWPENYSVNSAQKVWGAKFAARHPQVAVLDLSSFKCGHDAPTYGIINNVLAASGTPHLCLHDIDANKPGGSIKIRVRTYAYALERYRQRLLPKETAPSAQPQTEKRISAHVR